MGEAGEYLPWHNVIGTDAYESIVNSWNGSQIKPTNTVPNRGKVPSSKYNFATRSSTSLITSKRQKSIRRPFSGKFSRFRINSYSAYKVNFESVFLRKGNHNACAFKLSVIFPLWGKRSRYMGRNYRVDSFAIYSYGPSHLPAGIFYYLDGKTIKHAIGFSRIRPVHWCSK